MTTLPADEDYARALLSVFGLKNVRPRQSLVRAEAKVAFLSRNLGREEDFDAALSYAVSRGWLWSGFGMLRLTEEGGDEMQTIGPGRDDWSEALHWPQRPNFPAVKSGL
jgi:hypothetical protein